MKRGHLLIARKTRFISRSAIDRNSRIIIGCFVGNRTLKSAHKLWASLPEIYQQCAIAYTDCWQAYKTVIPAKWHLSVGKETSQTNHIERLNNTFRQRVSRAGKRKFIILQKARQSPWGDLVLHLWLECRVGYDLSLTTTSISLPIFATETLLTSKRNIGTIHFAQKTHFSIVRIHGEQQTS